MPIVNGYTTLALLKARLGITDPAETADDSILEAIVTAVSRQIDDWTHRRFYAVSETRYFTAQRPDRLLVDDLLSVSALVTDEDGDRTYETTWTSSDYDLKPFNAQLESQPRPYWEIATTPEGDYCFPVRVAKGVKITGSWGYSSSTPAVVSEACLLLAEGVYRTKDHPLGFAGGGEFTTALRQVGMHPFVQRMLAPYRRVTV